MVDCSLLNDRQPSTSQIGRFVGRNITPTPPPPIRKLHKNTPIIEPSLPKNRLIIFRLHSQLRSHLVQRNSCMRRLQNGHSGPFLTVFFPISGRWGCKFGKPVLAGPIFTNDISSPTGAYPPPAPTTSTRPLVKGLLII